MTVLARWLCASVSVVLLAFSVAAVFRTSNEIAATASLVISAIFGLMGITGLPIIGFEVTRERIALQLGRVAEKLAPTMPEQAQDLANQAALLASPQVSGQLSGLRYELAVVDAIRRSLRDEQATVLASTELSGRERADAIVILGRGSRIAIETKLVTAQTMVARRVREVLGRYAEHRGVDGLVIVIGGGSDEDVEKAGDSLSSRTSIPSAVVGWNPGDDPARLANAIREVASSILPKS